MGGHRQQSLSSPPLPDDNCIFSIQSPADCPIACAVCCGIRLLDEILNPPVKRLSRHGCYTVAAQTVDKPNGYRKPHHIAPRALVVLVLKVL